MPSLITRRELRQMERPEEKGAPGTHEGSGDSAMWAQVASGPFTCYQKAALPCGPFSLVLH